MSGYFFPFGFIAGQFKKLLGDKKKAESTRRRSEGAKRGWITRREKAAKDNPQNELPL